MQAALPSTMRRDLLSAYLAAGSKILSWVVVGGLVYRVSGAGAFALLALIRGTLGLLNYVTFGLSPAIMHLASSAVAPATMTDPEHGPRPTVLDYERRGDHPLAALYTNATVVSYVTFGAGLFLLLGYAVLFPRLHRTDLTPGPPIHVFFVVLFMGCGLLIRLVSDMLGAFIQMHGRIARDNYCVTLAELSWLVFAVTIVFLSRLPALPAVALAYALSGMVLITLRALASSDFRTLRLNRRLVDRATVIRLLSFGLLVTAAQLADFLYAPIDYILINRLLDPLLVAVYALAVQIDAGLILLVVGLANVLLPKTSTAHAAGNVTLIRRYYIRGTLASAGMLIMGAVGVYVASPWIFRLWFGTPMEATRGVLPLVLIHTVVGGSSAVGRSVLLGMGRVKVYTIAALLAGVANVVLSYAFVKYAGLGLTGIILGTIVVVVVRCGVWMPWYVMRAIGKT